MNVPFLDLKANYQPIKEQILTEITDVLNNTAYILGAKVEQFEKDFAAIHNVKHCVALSSGTDGNHLALWVLGIGSGDEVIIPVNTFIATAWGATLCGARPVFVDCEVDSYNLDSMKLEKVITNKTKAVVVVHLYGQPVNIEPIKEICDKKGIYLVEDCAQAHISQYKGKPVGGFGITSSFSFYPGKNLGAYGEGGAFMTNDDVLAAKAKMFRDHGSPQKYYHEYYGHNYRMEAIQGAVLKTKLPHLEEWTNNRRRVAKRYGELLKGVGDLILPKEMPYARHVYHLYIVQTEKRDELQKFLKDKNIGTGLHYPVPLHLQKCFSSLGYKLGDFPISETLANRCLSLPMYPELTEQQIIFVAEAIKEFFKR
jgi:dTDP-4-amino-4,6-dideoxygalactose transaminase